MNDARGETGREKRTDGRDGGDDLSKLKPDGDNKANEGENDQL